jgi:hypothetical protein
LREWGSDLALRSFGSEFGLINLGYVGTNWEKTDLINPNPAEACALEWLIQNEQ